VTESETIAQLDIEQCHRIVVARALTYCQRRGRTSEARDALTAAGLTDYLPPSGDRALTIPADALTRALTDKPLIISVDEDDDPQDVTECLTEQLMEHVAAWVLENVQPPPPGPHAFDIRATIGQHGLSGTIGWPDVAEVAQELKRIVLAVLTWGEQEDICEELERVIELIGLRPYMPPPQVAVTMPLAPGGEPVTLTVKADRLGRPIATAVKEAAQEALDEYIDEAVQAATVNPVNPVNPATGVVGLWAQ